MHKIPPNRIRKIRTWVPGNHSTELISSNSSYQHKSLPLLDLASNDYLGLSKHPNLIEAACKTMHCEGVGAGGSRLITGSRPIHRSLEETLGDWLQRDHVLLFPSGFQANLAGVIALTNRHTPVLVDRLIHHSLLMGVKASGAKLQRYSHNNLDELKKYLKIFRKKHPQHPPLVITESLFSMEGTSPNLKCLAEICAEYGARLFIDEAHALGVLGKEGRGLCYQLTSPITMISGTFGKAFGSGGAFLASNKEIGEHLIQTSGAFRYTTALAPPLCAAALEALNLIKTHPSWHLELQEKAATWRQKLTRQGWQSPHGTGPIIPLLIGSDQAALDTQKKLEQQGLLTIAIRPPTVPEGSSRLRLVVRRNLPENTLKNLLTALGDQ